MEFPVESNHPMRGQRTCLVLAWRMYGVFLSHAVCFTPSVASRAVIGWKWGDDVLSIEGIKRGRQDPNELFFLTKWYADA